ncbi:hypothetical protein B296_00051145, partial [Ensete ventricosum]
KMGDEALKKRSRVATFGQPVGATGSSAKTLAEKGKEPAEVEEVLECGYSIRELCEVDGRAGADRYFIAHMSKLPQAKGDKLLMPWWSLFFESTRVWTEGPLATEYLRGLFTPSSRISYMNAPHRS